MSSRPVFQVAFGRRLLQIFGVVLILGGSLAQTPLRVQAGSPATFTVNTTADTVDDSPGNGVCADAASNCSLRAAIMEANADPGSTIQFSSSLNGIPIVLTRVGNDYTADSGDLDINASMTITGNGASNTIIQAAADASYTGSIGDKVFGVNQSGLYTNLTVNFSGLTIRYGDNNIPLSDPDFAYTGGGVDVYFTGSGNSTTFTNCVISNNRSRTSYGGGLNVDSSATGTNTLTLTNVTFSNNSTLSTTTTSNGGALNVFGNNVTIDIQNSTFANNTVPAASRYGGAINFDPNNGSLTVDGTIFSGNSAQRGGAVWITDNTATITHSQFTGNTASDSGGAVAVTGGTLNLHYNRLIGNSATATPASGGLVVYGGTVGATDNWWGCNTGPGGACNGALLSAGSLTTSPYLYLTNTPSPATVGGGGSSTLTAGFLLDSASNPIAPADLGAMTGMSVSWNATNGTLSGQQTTMPSGGTAMATLTNNNNCTDSTGSAAIDSASATATLTVQCADLTVAKSNNVGGSTVLPTGWNWTIHIANGGVGPADFLNGETLLTDSLPASGLTYGTPSISGASGLTGTVTCAIDGSSNLNCTASGPVLLTAGGSFDVVFTTTPIAVGPYVNPRPAGSCAVDPGSTIVESNEFNNPCNSNTVTVNTPPVITSADNTIFELGIAGSFTVTTTPGYPVPMTISAVGSLPGGVTFTDVGNGTATLAGTPGTEGLYPITITAANGTLPNATQNFSLAVGVDPSTLSFTRHTPATSPTNADTLVFRATFSEAVTGVDTADFAVNGATTAAVANVNPVSSSVYDVTVSGGNLAFFDGVVGLNLNAPTIIDSTGNALPGTEPPIDETYTLDNTAPAVTINQAVGQSDPTNTGTINFTAVFSESVGTSFVTGDVTLSGTAGATTANVSEIAPHDGTTYNIAVSGMTTGGTVIASILAGKAQDLAGNNNTASTSTDNTVTYVPPTDLSITKTDGVTTAVPGGSVTYTITASNAGPNADPSATVADTFPASLTGTWTCVGAGGGTCTASGSGNINDSVNLPVGGSVTYTVSTSISASATGTLSNTATVSSSISDTNPANNSATDTDTLTPQADLAITKTDGVTTAVPGGSVTYTITASNAGPSTSSGATVADTFPASLTPTWTCAGAGGGMCTASGSGNINDTVNLPVGGSVTYTVNATVNLNATGTLSNTATVTAPGGVTDPTPGNNSATDTDTLTPQADLSITKTDGVTIAVAGGSLTYTITASNAGPSNAFGATVADTFPASLTPTWTCAGAGGGNCTASGSGNINDTVNLPAGGSVTYTVNAAVSLSATGTLSNTATVTAPGGVTDPTPGNNSATDSDSAFPPVDVTIDQAPAQADPTNASPINFRVVFAAAVTGFSDASDVSLSGTAGATTVAIIPVSSTIYTVAVGGMTGNGTVIASIPAGVATGSHGEPNAASTSTDHSVTYDATAPDTTITGTHGLGVPPGPGTITNVNTATFDFTGNDGTGVGGLTFSCKLDTGPYVACNSGSISYTGLADDSHTFYVYATDSLGNADASPATHTWTVDTTSPTVLSLTSTTTSSTNVSPIPVTITFSEPVCGFDSATGVDLNVTNGTTSSLTSGSNGSSVYTFNLTPSGQGLVSLYLMANRVSDGDCVTPLNPNTTNSSTFSRTYDTVAPTVTINQAVGQADPTSAVPVNFTATFSEAVTGFTGADVDLSASTAPGALSATVTEIAPMNGTKYTVGITGMTGDGTVIAFIPAGGIMDLAGNPTLIGSTSTDNSVTYIYAAPPVITEGASVALTMDKNGIPTPFALTLHATDTNSDPLTWSILTPASHGSAGVAPGPSNAAAVSYTPLSTYYGSDSFVVKVSDGALTDSITVTVIIDDSLPVITEGASTTVTMSENGIPTPFALTLHATDFNSDLLTWSMLTPASHGTAGVGASSGVVSYTPTTNYYGSDTFVVQVSDGALTDSITVNVTIVKKPDPTVTINQAASQTDPTNDSPINFTAVFSERVTGFIDTDVTLGGTAGATAADVTEIAPMDGTTYNVAVSGMTSFGTVIVSIPAGSAQDYAANGNTASTSTDNTVTYQNDPPVITAGDSTNVTMSWNSTPTPFALTLVAIDPNPDVLAWSIISPASFGTAGVDPVSGVVSYVPLPNYYGTDNFVVQVSDGHGGTDSITVNVTIVPTSDPGPLIWNQSYDIQYDTWLGRQDPNAFNDGFREATSGQFKFVMRLPSRKVTWLTYLGPDQGKAQVLVDGVVKKTVDLYSPMPQWQYQVVVAGLTNMRHTVAIKALNAKNPASSGKWVVVDGFKVGTNFYDDQFIGYPRMFSYGSWLGLKSPQARFGAYRISSTANATMRFSFDGIKLTFVTVRGPSYGKAAIYVDGVLKKTVDLYKAGAEQWMYRVVISGLPYGHHDVKVVVLGTKNVHSTGIGIVCDGFEIR